jgi:alpha-N-arabinofuranosidase
MAIGRRQFVRGAAVGVGAAFLARYSGIAASPTSDARIDILLDEPLGTISPDIYGHFAEHLGGVVYDGIWVGEGSKVANVGGIRKSLVEALQKIKAPVVRWPGGCFADSYDWKDGIGPAEKRPRRTNFWVGDPLVRDAGNIPQKYDPNTFGTNEFVRFCKLAGCQPYLAANLRSLPAEDFYRWVEYCNSPAGSTTLAEMRAAGGSRDPFGVRFWGIGNESWGCGGNFTPAEYAVEYRRFVEWVPGFGERLSFIASGPNGADWNWTREFLRTLTEKGTGSIGSVYGLSLHYYSWNLSRGKTQDWNQGKGDAVNFDAVDWYELLREGDKMESLITGHWQVMSEIDRMHHIKLVVDEWGPWYRPGSEVAPTHMLGQMITLRDAVMSAMTLDTFNRHPDKVIMANCAQLINCLNSLFLAHEDKFVLTPVYHVFQMYAVHQGAQAVRVNIESPSVNYTRDDKPATFWGLKGSASLRGKELAITIVNPDVSGPREATINVGAEVARSGPVTTLTSSDIHAHNTFENPDVVRPQVQEIKVRGSEMRCVFPPASVTLFQVTLA